MSQQAVRPDEGMALLYTGSVPPGTDYYPPEKFPLSGPAAAPAHAAPAAAAEFDVMARLELCLDGLTKAANRLTAAVTREQAEWAECHPIEIPPQQSAAAGVLDDPDRWGPQDGFAWLVTRLTVTLGTGGTTWSAYRDAAVVNGNPVPNNLLFGPVASGTWEPKSLILMPGQRIVVQSLGAGVTVTGEAIEVGINSLYRFLI